MSRVYILTLEIVPLGVGRIYDELPPHLTLMSRFLSNLSPDELAIKTKLLFAQTPPVSLVFGETTVLGPKKVIAHMVDSPEELRLHNALCTLLDAIKVDHQYPEFIGDNHKPHVTARKGVQFVSGSEHASSTAYLIEVINKKRIVRAKFTLSGA